MRRDMRRLRTWYGFLMALIVLASYAGAQEQPLTAAEFVYAASEAGIADVAVGRLALANSKSSDVQRFALAAIADHDTANDELKILARKKGLTVIEEAAAVENAEHMMADVTTEDFDKAYANEQLKTHEALIRLFSTAASQVSDEELRNYAVEKLPMLQRHLEMATDLARNRI
jgi:putative membrane protein